MDRDHLSDCSSAACLQGMVAKIMRSSTFEIAFPIPPFTRVSFFVFAKWPLNLIELQFLQATDLLLLCQFPSSSSSATGNNISSGTIKKIANIFNYKSLSAISLVKSTSSSLMCPLQCGWWQMMIKDNQICLFCERVEQIKRHRTHSTTTPPPRAPSLLLYSISCNFKCPPTPCIVFIFGLFIRYLIALIIIISIIVVVGKYLESRRRPQHPRQVRTKSSLIERPPPHRQTRHDDPAVSSNNGAELWVNTIEGRSSRYR